MTWFDCIKVVYNWDSTGGDSGNWESLFSEFIFTEGATGWADCGIAEHVLGLVGAESRLLISRETMGAWKGAMAREVEIETPEQATFYALFLQVVVLLIRDLDSAARSLLVSLRPEVWAILHSLPAALELPHRVVREQLISMYSTLLTISCDSRSIYDMYRRVLDNTLDEEILSTLAKYSSDPTRRNHLLVKNAQFSPCDVNTCGLQNGFTIYFEVLFDNVSSCRFMTMASVIPGTLLHVDLIDSKLALSNDDLALVFFDGLEFESNRLYVFCIISDKRRLKIFVDGQYLGQTSTLDYSNTSMNMEYLTIGSSNCALRLYNLQLWDQALSENISHDMYLSTPFFMQYFNNIDSRSKTSHTVLQSMGTKKLILFPGKHYRKHEKYLEDLLSILDLKRLKYSWSAHQHYEDAKKSSSLPFSGTLSNILSEDMCSRFLSIGCFEFLFHALCHCQDVAKLKALLYQVLHLLKNIDYRVYFDQEHGFAFLSHVLSYHVIPRFRVPLSSEVLDLFMDFEGINASENSYYGVVDPEFYSYIMMNLDLWIYYKASDSHSVYDIFTLRKLLDKIPSFLNSAVFDFSKVESTFLNDCFQDFLFKLYNLHDSIIDVFSILQRELIVAIRGYLEHDSSKHKLQWFLNLTFIEIKHQKFSLSEINVRVLNEMLDDAMIHGRSEVLSLFQISNSMKYGILLLHTAIEVRSDPCSYCSLIVRLMLYVNHQSNILELRKNISILRSMVIKNNPDVILSVISIINEVKDTVSMVDKSQVSLSTRAIECELMVLVMDLFEWLVLKHSSSQDPDAFFSVLSNVLSSLESELESSEYNRNINYLAILLSGLTSLSHTLSNSYIAEHSNPTSEKLTNFMLEIFFRCQASYSEPDYKRFFKSFSCCSTSNIDTLRYRVNELTQLEFALYVFPSLVKRTLNSLETLLIQDDIVRLSVNFNFLVSELKDVVFWLLPDLETYLNSLKCGLMIYEKVFNNGRSLDNAMHVFKKNLSANIRYLLSNIIYRITFLHSDTHICHGTKFFKIVLIYQQVLFDIKTHILNYEDIAFFLIFIGIYLHANDCPPYSIDCIRTLIIFNMDALSNIACHVQMDYHKKIEDSLAAFVKVENEEGNLYLHVNCGYLFSTIQKNRLKKRLCKDLQLNNPTRTVFSSREESMKHVNYLHSGKIGSAAERSKLNENNFLNIIIPLDKRLSGVAHRFLRYANNDLRDLFNFNEKKLITLIEQFRHRVQIISKGDAKIVWKLDQLQNYDGMRIRLLPAYNALTKDYSSTFRYEIIDSDKENESNCSAAASYVSYGIISESDISDIGISIDENRHVLKLLRDNDAIGNIWNCCWVDGLKLTEGILIRGTKNIYYLGGFYYDTKSRTVINLKDVSETVRDKSIRLITGKSECIDDLPASGLVQRWKLKDILSIMKRSFLLRDTGIEILFANGYGCFISFDSSNTRNIAFAELYDLRTIKPTDPILSRVLDEINRNGMKLVTQNGISKASLTTKLANVFSPKQKLLDGNSVTSKWLAGEMSNFYYLLSLNALAGRTFNDLTQYSVFPWVIADYCSSNLDLGCPSSFRNLEEPMGAQSASRKSQFVNRYEALRDLVDTSDPPFHYGTHYSSAMIVSSYLVRLQPFTDSYRLLQDGNFGPPDRIFNSICRAWKSASFENTTDVRELIPEFYCLPEFLLNINACSFGHSQDGKLISDVVLPEWAGNNPMAFIERMREALESPEVSQMLHNWIDLIFGVKQRGYEAIKATNVFHNLSYPGAVDLDAIADERSKMEVTSIIHNFGQTPLQIFQDSHPRKLQTSINKFNDVMFRKWNKAVFVSADNYCNGNEVRSILTYSAKDAILRCDVHSFPALQRKVKKKKLSAIIAFGGSFTTGQVTYCNAHKSRITDMIWGIGGSIITADAYGLIKVWRCEFGHQSSSIYFKEHAVLTGHLSPIVSLHLSIEYNTLLSLDEEGIVYTWDLTENRIIRAIAYDATAINISQQWGTIAVSHKTGHIGIYNINGLCYLRNIFRNNLQCTARVLHFIDLTDKAFYGGQYRKHVYFHGTRDILCIGYDDGHTEIRKLSLSDDGKWTLSLLSDLIPDFSEAISCITSVTFSRPKLEDYDLYLLVGTVSGEIYSWKALAS